MAWDILTRDHTNRYFSQGKIMASNIIFSTYQTLPQLMAGFVARNPALGRDIATAIYLNAHNFYMRELAAKNTLRMVYYVFSKNEVVALENLAKSKLERVAILDPFAEALFISQNSRADIDTLFNLYFAPSGGLFNNVAAVDAYKIAAKNYGIDFLDVDNLVYQVKKLPVHQYAVFMASVVSGIKVLNPQGYADGINKFKDFLNETLVNINSYISSAQGQAREIANRQTIIDALELPKNNLAFQEEYLKNLDLSLFTRMALQGLSEVVPRDDNLVLSKVMGVWRNNARSKLGDINTAVLPYPVHPPSTDYTKIVAGIAITVVAIAVVAPYALSAANAAIAKTTALGAAAVGKVGAIATTATTAAIKTKAAIAQNEAIEKEKQKTLAQLNETQSALAETKTVINKDSGFKIESMLPLLAAATFLSK